MTDNMNVLFHDLKSSPMYAKLTFCPRSLYD